MFALPFLIIVMLPSIIYLIVRRIRQNRQSHTLAFFHPYCDAGGGGERVLWRAINALQKRFPTLKIVIYTGDLDKTPEEILEKARSRFGIFIPSDKQRLQFIYLRTRWLLEASNYPRLTMIGQLIAGLVVGTEALWRHCPEWFIDTTGCPLTLPLFRWIAGAITLCYVHYPTITTEMIELVKSRQNTYNNSALITSNPIFTHCKLLYYRIIALLYGFCGRCSQLTMVNGSWTAAHIAQLWSCKPHIVFPPCDVERLINLDNQSEQLFEEQQQQQARHNDGNGSDSTPLLILSVGQIRPEKNHLEQLRIFDEIRHRLLERGSNIKTKLVIAGGCRNADDQKRVQFLQAYAHGNFGLMPDLDVDWQLNVPFERLLELMQNSMIGLHTMWNEHFGISVVEGMAAGMIMVTHNSGGPKLDIIGDGNKNNDCNDIDKKSVYGLLARTKDEYADAIVHVLLDMSRHQRDQIRSAARQKVAKKFTDKQFDQEFCDAFSELFLHTDEANTIAADSTE